jgi:hypothetical protein
MVNLGDIHSLNRPRFTSFVATARIVSTSAIISTIMSLIAMVGVIPVYISSRPKKRSMRLKSSMSLSWLALASLTAWEPCVSKWAALGNHEGHRPRGERRSPQISHLPVEMPASIYLSRDYSRENVLILTSPIPCPIVSENAYKTFTVGLTHFVRPSSPFWDWLNAGICSRRTVRMASGESQD